MNQKGFLTKLIFGIVLGIVMAGALGLIISNAMKFGEPKWKIVTIEDSKEDGSVAEGFYEVDAEGKTREIEAAPYDDSRQYYLDCLTYYEDEEGEIASIELSECTVLKGEDGMLVDWDEGEIMEVKDGIAALVYELFSDKDWHLWAIDNDETWWVIANLDDGSAEIFTYDGQGLIREFTLSGKYVEFVEGV